MCDCSPPCPNMYFRREELSFARYFIGLISVICLSATFTFLTFLIDVIRFPYPERPIIIYGVCYMMVSLIFFVGFFLEDRVACNASSPAQYKASTVTQGSHNKACIMLFMILYFFLLCLAAFDGCFLPSRGSWQLCQSGVLKLLRRKPCYFVPVRGASLEH